MLRLYKDIYSFEVFINLMRNDNKVWLHIVCITLSNLFYFYYYLWDFPTLKLHSPHCFLWYSWGITISKASSKGVLTSAKYIEGSMGGNNSNYNFNFFRLVSAIWLRDRGSEETGNGQSERWMLASTRERRIRDCTTCAICQFYQSYLLSVVNSLIFFNEVSVCCYAIIVPNIEINYSFSVAFTLKKLSYKHKNHCL